MPAVSLSPALNEAQFFSNLGVPLNGGKIFSYQAGSFSTQAPTYTSASGAVANANPIVLDSSGRSGTSIWLDDAQSYNLVLTQSDGTTVLRSYDDVTGVPPQPVAGSGINVWNAIAVAPTFINATNFIVTGDFTTEFAVGNRVRFTVGSGFGYGTVSASVYSVPNTTVTLINDTIALDSSISAVFWSTLVVGGITVDAGAVKYTSALTYPAGTVGNQIQSAAAAATSLGSRISSTYVVLPLTGAPAYVGTADAAIVSYAVGQTFNVQFNGAASGACTLNINGIGAVSLKQYDYLGNRVNPVIGAFMVSPVLYDGTYFMIIAARPTAYAYPTVYHMAQPLGASSSRTVYLTAGTWTLSLLTIGQDRDDLSTGNSNFTVTQTATLVTIGNITSSFAMFRSGGAGYGRIVGGQDLAVSSFAIVSEQNYTLQLGPVVVTGSGTGNYIPRGAFVTLEKQ
jgi:hypothetical protein